MRLQCAPASDPPSGKTILPEEFKRTSSCPPVGDEPHAATYIPTHTPHQESSPRSQKTSTRGGFHGGPRLQHPQIHRPAPSIRRPDADQDSTDPNLAAEPPAQHYPNPGPHYPNSPQYSAQSITPKTPQHHTPQNMHGENTYSPKPGHNRGGTGGNRKNFMPENEYYQYNQDVAQGYSPHLSNFAEQARMNYNPTRSYASQPISHVHFTDAQLAYSHHAPHHNSYISPHQMYAHGYQQGPMNPMIQDYHNPHIVGMSNSRFNPFNRVPDVANRMDFVQHGPPFGSTWQTGTPVAYNPHPPQVPPEKLIDLTKFKDKKILKIEDPVTKAAANTDVTQPAKETNIMAESKNDSVIETSQPQATNPDTGLANGNSTDNDLSLHVSAPINNTGNVAEDTTNENLGNTKDCPEETTKSSEEPVLAHDDELSKRNSENDIAEKDEHKDEHKDATCSEQRDEQPYIPEEPSTSVVEESISLPPENAVVQLEDTADIPTVAALVEYTKLPVNEAKEILSEPDGSVSPPPSDEQISTSTANQVVEEIIPADSNGHQSNAESAQSASASVRILSINQILKSRYMKLPAATITTLKKLSLYNPRPEVARLHELIIPIAPVVSSVRPQFNTGEHSIVREFRGLINKVTFTTYDTIMSKIKEVKIESIELMRNINSVIFETAVKQPIFCPLYARVCHDLSSVFPKFKDEGNVEVTFRRILLSSCQAEFERKIETPDPNLSEEEKFMFRKKERMRQIGNIRLVGEIYKRGYLPDTIIESCIKSLTTEESNSILDPEAIECLCHLLLTVGSKYAVPEKVENLKNCNAAFAKLKAISDNTQYDLRTRFMCLDTIDARGNNWERRIKETGPKHISEVHKEIQEEEDALLNRVNQLPKPTQAQPSKTITRTLSGMKIDRSVLDHMGSETSLKPKTSWNQPPKAPTSGASQTSGAGFSYVQKVVKAPLKKELSANKYSEMNPEDLEGEVRKILAAFEVSSDDTILSETVLQMKTNKNYNMIPKFMWRYLAESKQENHRAILSLLEKLVSNSQFSHSEWKESFASACGDITDWSMDAPMAPNYVSKAINILYVKNVLSLEDIYGPEGALAKCDKEFVIPGTLATFACEIFSLVAGASGRDAAVAQLKKIKANVESWFQDPSSIAEAKQKVEELGCKDVF